MSDEVEHAGTKRKYFNENQNEDFQSAKNTKFDRSKIKTFIPSVNFPSHVLESIFGCIPGIDMLTVCKQVCFHWNELIKNDQFMPWKKLYMKVRSCDVNSYNYVKAMLQISGPDEEFILDSPFRYNVFAIVSLIRLMHVLKPTRLSKEEVNKTVKSLQKHDLYSFALKVVKSQVVADINKMDNMNICWMLASTILILSTSSRSLQMLSNCLLQHHQLHVVMDFFYLAAVCSWLLYKEKLLNQDLHYRIFSFIASVENSTLPKPKTEDVNPDFEKLTYEQLKVASHKFQIGEVIRIVAYAGTGKTTTLASCVKMNPRLKFLYTSFGKTVVDQGKHFFSDCFNVDCRTLHSLAFTGMNMRSYNGKLSRGSLRISYVRKKLNISSHDKQLPSLIIETINKFLASSDSGIAFSHVPVKQKVIHDYLERIPSERRKDILKLSKIFYQNMCDLTNNRWQMTNDCYLKQWQLSQPCIDKYDVILFDEAQDCTDCMLDILKRQTAHSTLVLIGDSHQQIYGFRLASDALKTVPSTHSYYLTQSFRFGHDIARVADHILRTLKFNDLSSQQINQASNVTDKTLLGVGQPGTISGEEAENGQIAVLCRNNHNVIKVVLSTLQANPNKKVAIVGGVAKLDLDLLKDLYALTKPVLKRTGKWKITRKYLRNYSSLKELTQEVLLSDDEDILSKIAIVYSLGDSLPKAVEILKGLPNDLKAAEVVVSTIHEAKSLEFDTVKIDDDLAFVIINWLIISVEVGMELDQFNTDEVNLLYVAATRAKKSLILSKGLCRLLDFTKVHFIVPRQPSAEWKDKEEFCLYCKSVLSFRSVLVLYQPKILLMQEEGFLCSRCGSLLAPGWGHILGDPVEI